MLINFPFGVGYHHYSAVFNHEQAKYFLGHSIINKTALLANDGYYPLNEFLYVGIEFGIVGLTMMIAIIFLIIKKIIEIYKQRELLSIKIYAILYFVNLFVLCLFSYPLHFSLVILFAVLAFNILFNYPIIKLFKIVFNYSIVCGYLLVLGILIGLVFFPIKYYQNELFIHMRWKT